MVFLEKFMPQSSREELRRQFEQLRQGDISVMQYEMRLSELAYHAIWLVLTDRERIMRFIDGLTFQLRLLMTRERVSGATFDEFVDIARDQFQHGRGRHFKRVETTQPFYRGASSGHGSHSHQQGQSSFSALLTQSSHHAPPTQVSSGSSFGHQEQQFRQRRGCFECGDFGHIMRDCPRLLGGTPQRSIRLMAPTPVSLPPVQPARGGAQPPRGGFQSARGRPRGGGRLGVVRLVSMPSLPDQMLLLQML
ncbi:uncharacterized protein [Nicotiana tomentosiformis]|uniref:uncharacterized protein n=1 Tax=Nicotiana tomentosiformis TaxID=4098 RepID=UPI00388CE0AD